MASLAAAATGAEILNAIPSLIGENVFRTINLRLRFRNALPNIMHSDSGIRLSSQQWNTWKEYQNRQAAGRAWVYNKTNQGVTFYSYNNLSVIRLTTNQQYYVGVGKCGAVYGFSVAQKCE